LGVRTNPLAASVAIESRHGNVFLSPNQRFP
jgi:hypothetical protein